VAFCAAARYGKQAQARAKTGRSSRMMFSLLMAVESHTSYGATDSRAVQSLQEVGLVGVWGRAWYELGMSLL
jgi:hypothetical protein